MNFFSPLFSWSFWFSYYATPFSPWVSNLILVSMAVIAFVSVMFWIWKRRLNSVIARHAASRISVLGFSASITGLLLWLFTYENIPFLSARIFWVFWVMIFGAWKWWIYRTYKKDQADARLTSDPELEAYQKYLPKPKKGKR